jgi:hypothetical protein
MLRVYEDHAGDEIVLQTCVSGTMRLEIESDGTVRLVTEDSQRYEPYGWGDDDEGGGGAKGSVPPSSPPPKRSRAPQTAPRERYG